MEKYVFKIKDQSSLVLFVMCLGKRMMRVIGEMLDEQRRTQKPEPPLEEEED